jgi:hypothetical protein
MTDEKPLKSAVELAMERLRKQDADAGIESVPLTDAQKASIAEVRNFYHAKIAQIDVLRESKVRATFNPEERARFEAEFRADRDRLTSERDAKIEKIRRGGA